MNYKLTKLSPKIQDKLIISNKFTLKKTLSVINRNINKILFIIDSEHKLIGSITDGDLRRMYYKNISIDTNLQRVSFNKPQTIKKVTKISTNIIKKKIEFLPLINDKNEIVSIYKVSYFKTHFKENSIFILAGGKGERLKPITNNIPKPLIKISGKTLIHHIIEKFINQNYYQFNISINYLGEKIIKSISDLKFSKIYKFNYIKEKKPLGTAGSLYFLKNKIINPIVVINSDIIFDFDVDKILQFHEKSKADLTAVSIKKIYKNPYGVIIEKGKNIKDIIEKPEYKFDIMIGMYVISPKCLLELKTLNQIDMNIFLKKLIKKKYKVKKFVIDTNYFIDIGNLENYDHANKFFN